MDKESKNIVIVLGTIHSGHFEHKSYSLGVLKSIIETVDPDFILAEIPPDRFEKVMSDWKQNRYILDHRVNQFPEYADVIIPLTDKLKFKLIPTAAWTEEMSINREAALDRIYQDPSKRADITMYQQGVAEAEKILRSVDDEYDPLWVNSEKYDEAIEIQMNAFSNAFDKDLGIGGWQRINHAHYALMEKALDRLKFQGKKILITFGAGHRGWLLKALSKRDDIIIQDLISSL